MGVKLSDIMIAVSTALTFLDLYIAKGCLEERDTLARRLGFTALLAAAAELAYTLCAVVQNPLWKAFYFNTYCISVDWMLLGMLSFLFLYSSKRPAPIWRRIGEMLVVWTVLETIVLVLNILWKVSSGYMMQEDSRFFLTTSRAPHIIHFFYSYGLMVFGFGYSAMQFLRTPKPYRNPYGYIVAGMLLVLALNWVSPWPGISAYAGYSLRGYSYVLMIMYWVYFRYMRRDLQKGLSIEIFENIGQGIVLFDYNDLLMMQNNRAQELLAGVVFVPHMKVSEFLSQLNFPTPRKSRERPCTSQCYLRNGTAVRCDFRPLRNEKGKKLGELYVFTESDLDTDLLTGFQRWESFLKQCEGKLARRRRSVAVFDLNRLGEINSREGVNEGDRQIRLLAGAMRKCLPADTQFVRGQDAVLIAICNDFDGEMMRQYAQNVQAAYEGETLYAVCGAEDENANPAALVEDAMHGLLVKKLLDSNSSHSQTLTSLVRALQECDSDTEAHVQRTQELGRELGKRIGLTDCQQSDLSLLCLLHDIGKIGIPLDILNKPFRLTAEERALIRSHAEKGYQIALSSDKLSFIADMIRHHHERWDGTGYPDGLSREEIPLLSRIIAVVDAYDAMTNDRTYHKGIPIAKALDEIHRCSGTQFDPIIAAEFIRMIREMYADTLSAQEKAPKVETKVVDSRQAQVDASAVNVYPILFSRYLLDANNRIIDADVNFERITGYTETDWKNGELTQMSMLPPDARQEYGAFLATQLRNSTFAYLEHRLRRKDGHELFVFCYGEVFYDHSVKEQRSQIFITDITTSHSARMMIMAESSKSEKQLRYWEELYRRDPTTGLLNHIAFQNDVEALLHKKEQRILLMMLNVDFFNKYTDAYGHDAGDRLLRELGRTMKDVSRAVDMCCRMGGDEFAVAFLITQEAANQQIWDLAERFYDELTHTLKAIHPEWSLSAGLALSGETARTFKELYRMADAALYQAKREGRGKMIWPDGGC